mmetsp:Transcript_9205/g.30676  ORF Transcript_9205/g.30676 Transcript_9205/m.30676 type:complete len:309 (-) Transcript_9205:3018-3944(-)
MPNRLLAFLSAGSTQLWRRERSANVSCGVPPTKSRAGTSSRPSSSSPVMTTCEPTLFPLSRFSRMSSRTSSAYLTVGRAMANAADLRWELLKCLWEVRGRGEDVFPLAACCDDATEPPLSVLLKSSVSVVLSSSLSSDSSTEMRRTAEEREVSTEATETLACLHTHVMLRKEPAAACRPTLMASTPWLPSAVNFTRSRASDACSLLHRASARHSKFSSLNLEPVQCFSQKEVTADFLDSLKPLTSFCRLSMNFSASFCLPIARKILVSRKCVRFRSLLTAVTTSTPSSGFSDSPRRPLACSTTFLTRF